METEFSAGARAVWVDPHLMAGPLPPGFFPGLEMHGEGQQALAVQARLWHAWHACA